MDFRTADPTEPRAAAPAPGDDEILSDEEIRSRAAARAQQVYEQTLRMYRARRERALAAAKKVAPAEPVAKVDPDTGEVTFLGVSAEPVPADFVPAEEDVPAEEEFVPQAAPVPVENEAVEPAAPAAASAAEEREEKTSAALVALVVVAAAVASVFGHVVFSGKAPRGVPAAEAPAVVPAPPPETPSVPAQAPEPEPVPAPAPVAEPATAAKEDAEKKAEPVPAEPAKKKRDDILRIFGEDFGDY